MSDTDANSFSLGPIPPHWGMNFTKTIHTKPTESTEPANITLPPGYTVVVTGAGRQGIGENIAKAYTSAKANNIIITSRTLSDLENVKIQLEEMARKHDHAINVIPCQCDATEPEGYSRIGKILAENFAGRLDCLVLNAGGGETGGLDRPMHEREVQSFTKTTMLNYLGPYYGAMILMPFLLSPRSLGKTLITIISGAAHLLDIPSPAYNVAKLASIRMVETMAAHYTEQSLGCYALHPGNVATPGALKAAPELKDRRRHLVSSILNAADGWIVFTEDVRLAGAFCVWLSNERPLWLSGRYVSATWDADELKAMREEILAGDKLKFRMVV